MIGRAYLWGLGAAGQAGVENVLDILSGGIDLLTGFGACVRARPDTCRHRDSPDFTRILGRRPPGIGRLWCARATVVAWCRCCWSVCRDRSGCDIRAEPAENCLIAQQLTSFRFGGSTSGRGASQRAGKLDVEAAKRQEPPLVIPLGST